MSKALSEMTLEELWQLFPIVLTAHRDEWDAWYAEEKTHLAGLLHEHAVIHHIGSTAIAGIWAKPIVDLLVELPDRAALLEARSALAADGYRLMSEDERRISFNKGYTENGFAEKVFHIHLRLHGDCDELLFRDYLNAHADAAREYEALKLRLWKQFEHDRDGYTEAKTDFVLRITELARKAKTDIEQREEKGVAVFDQEKHNQEHPDYALIQKALRIAKEAHAGQTDKAGVDYIFHPITVALLCGSAKEKAVALLHDTLEDCPDKMSYELLVNEVGKEVADAVRLLTNDGTRGTYLEYVQSIKDSGNQTAIAVKRADLLMNMDLSLLPNPTEKDVQRVEVKYKPALRIIEA